jgi:phosphoribosylaminoimidazolecarboxamide formyltransferase/IMP cyclohydrolase
VSDKSGIVSLAQALQARGVEIFATGKTLQTLQAAGIQALAVEKLTGLPEAFQGRMKTLSFHLLSGILARRNDPKDLQDVERLEIPWVDVVVVNFYPFEQAVKNGISREELIEQIDIGGPTLVRAAAKNSPDTLVLVDPESYPAVIEELQETGQVSAELRDTLAARAWVRVADYDRAIANALGSEPVELLALRYGENPHQKGVMHVEANSPIVWPTKNAESLTKTELSYNNILDLSSAYALGSDLEILGKSSNSHQSTGVVIVKHSGPCGVALVRFKRGSASLEDAQAEALRLAWEGDPTSAFGGVVLLTDPILERSANQLKDVFIEALAAPGLTSTDPFFQKILEKRKRLKATRIRKFGEFPAWMRRSVVGGVLEQTPDMGLPGLGPEPPLEFVTSRKWDPTDGLTAFGVSCSRSLQSNAIAVVADFAQGPYEAFVYLGGGQGQPNRIDAIRTLALPRAEATMKRILALGWVGEWSQALVASDAFFPFRDSIDAIAAAGVKRIVQPGGSIQDQESIQASEEHQVAMAFTKVRHFRH